MQIIFRAALLGFVAIVLAACNNNAEGGYGDRKAAQIAAELGLAPEEFRRASVQEAEDRIGSVWTGGRGRLKFGTYSVDGESGRYLSVNGNGTIGRWKARSDADFKITGINEDGTIDIRFAQGQVCLTKNDGGEDRRCSKARRGSGTLTMYLADNFPDQIGLYLDYKIRGDDMRINSSNYYNGEWTAQFGAILEK